MRSRTANWFLCKIRYEKTMEDGLQKKVTEQYVVDAVSFTEAEARIIEQMSSYVSGEFDVVEIDRCKFGEVFFQDNFVEKMIQNNAEELLRAARLKNKDAGKKILDRSLEEDMKHAADVADKWYKAKLKFITIDEKTDKEKKTAAHYLVQAGSFEGARKNIEDVMGGTMIDYEIDTVSETPIMDVYEYVAKKEGES